VDFDSYVDAGLLAAIDLVNEFALGPRPAGETELQALERILSIDPSSVSALRRADVAGFGDLASSLLEVVTALDAGDVDRAADRLNTLLAAHPAHPHLAFEDGRWRLHHHAADAAVVPMWTSICAERLAHLIGIGEAHRIGRCAAPDCGRAYLDQSKNASRRFCSTTCQNRVKAAAFRRRHAAAD
jgi:predicted RNA-binding Zn ribbon-like protein